MEEAEADQENVTLAKEYEDTWIEETEAQESYYMEAEQPVINEEICTRGKHSGRFLSRRYTDRGASLPEVRAILLLKQ